jgi:hypothetical protein
MILPWPEASFLVGPGLRSGAGSSNHLGMILKKTAKGIFPVLKNWTIFSPLMGNEGFSKIAPVEREIFLGRSSPKLLKSSRFWTKCTYKVLL